MTLTVRQLIEAHDSPLVGRESERADLHLVLGPEGPVVVFVHGIGGVGKSALLETFTEEARRSGSIVLGLDGGTIEPTARGFLAALSSASGSGFETVDDAASRLSDLGSRVVIMLDRYEVLRPLDLWLQQEFVPALPDNVRMVIAGREAPMPGWSIKLGPLFQTLHLTNLSRDDAEALLRRDGVDGADLERINRLARGHPLSLRLAAAALAARPAHDPQATTVAAIVSELTELYLAGLDPTTRLALDAASVVRRPTLSLLAAMLPEAAPQDAFERLRRLPFVELSSDGLALHDTVREGVAAYLRASDPDRLRRYRIAAWRQLREEVGRASPHEMWRYTADLLFILENPMIREAFFPTTDHRYFVEGAQPDDWPSIEALVRRQQPAASGEILGGWWERDPGAFRVARDGSGVVAGCYVTGELDHIRRSVLDVDPVARRWRDHLRQAPVPRGQRVLFDRVDLVGEDEGLVNAALMLDLKRTYLELRPELRRIYTVDFEGVAGTAWERLGFVDMPGEPVRVDGVAYHVAFLDFGPASVDGWLTRIIATELQIDDDSMLDTAQHQLVLDGRRVDLTKLEFEVFAYLYERPGKVVERSSLLRDVWGYDYAGGSNVIEALIASLRRKLGDQAGVIETVRGLGYRLVAV